MRQRIMQHVPPMADPGAQLPPRALQVLKQAGDGVPVSFANGSAWAIRDGQPVRLW